MGGQRPLRLPRGCDGRLSLRLALTLCPAPPSISRFFLPPMGGPVPSPLSGAAAAAASVSRLIHSCQPSAMQRRPQRWSLKKQNRRQCWAIKLRGIGGGSINQAERSWLSLLFSLYGDGGSSFPLHAEDLRQRHC